MKNSISCNKVFDFQSTYAYAANNPVFYLDKDGEGREKPNLSKVTNVPNVLNSKSWVAYKSEITTKKRFWDLNIAKKPERENVLIIVDYRFNKVVEKVKIIPQWEQIIELICM